MNDEPETGSVGIPVPVPVTSPSQSPEPASGAPSGLSADVLTERIANAIQQVVLLTRAEAMDAARAARFVIENANRI